MEIIEGGDTIYPRKFPRGRSARGLRRDALEGNQKPILSADLTCRYIKVESAIFCFGKEPNFLSESLENIY